MKTILPFLFLISACCYGQEIDSVGLTIYPHDLDFYVSKQLSLEEKLLLYAQECWNDSTETKGEHIKINGWHGCKTVWVYSKDYMEEICITPSHYITKYIHRKPTFENFIEWLKNK